MSTTKPPRFTVAIHHGETRSVFYVVDNKTVSGWQPEILGSLNDLHGAKGICGKLNQLDRQEPDVPSRDILEHEKKCLEEIQEAIHHQIVSTPTHAWLKLQLAEIQNTLDIMDGLIEKP